MVKVLTPNHFSSLFLLFKLVKQIIIMKKILFMSAMMAFATLGNAQTEVVHGTVRGKDYGVVYMLPQTQIEIEALVTQVKYTPGEFAKYANRYLKLENVSTTPQEYYELTKINVVPVGMPDAEQTYFIKLKDKTVAPLVELTRDGIIKSINLSEKDNTTENRLTPTEYKASTVNPRDYLTEEILMANSSAKMAELISKEIYSIRESKNALLRGQADYMPKDGEQLKMMLDALNEQENALLSLFVGEYQKVEQIYTIKVAPKNMTNDVAFRFSRKLGVVDNKDLAGEPIYITVKDLETVNKVENNDKKKLEGIAYNVPGKALVELTKGKQVLYKGELALTQFGVTEYLAPVLFNKNSTIKVRFNPTTGGLIKVERDENK